MTDLTLTGLTPASHLVNGVGAFTMPKSAEHLTDEELLNELKRRQTPNIAENSLLDIMMSSPEEARRKSWKLISPGGWFVLITSGLFFLGMIIIIIIAGTTN